MRLIDAVVDSAAERLKLDCARLYGGRLSKVRVVHAPYRLCPIGAHIDHQLGVVSALAVDQGTLLAFLSNNEARVDIVSQDYPGAISFRVNELPVRAMDWADYARGAVTALSRKYQLTRGVSLLIQGRLGEAGLSSSAAVGLGYLLAIATANDLVLDATELIELDRIIENEFLGLKNGVLDPSAIALAEAQKLTVIDCAALISSHVAQPRDFVFLVVSSGLKEALVDSVKFNSRVVECLQAGAMLSNRVSETRLELCPLGRISFADWQAHGSILPGVHRKRAEHFFGETQRVQQGADAWERSDCASFGRLMTSSGLSSISNYETGSPEMIRLFEILSEGSGVWGARFSGAGFRGCAVALVEGDQIENIVAEVEARYLQAFPQFRHDLWAFTSCASRGLTLL